LEPGEEQGDKYESALDALPSTPSFEAVELLEDPREEILEEWYQTIPGSFVEFARGLQTVLQEVVETIPGLHRNFGGQWAMTADDLRKVEVRL
jgi:hypothetical protein